MSWISRSARNYRRNGQFVLQLLFFGLLVSSVFLSFNFSSPAIAEEGEQAGEQEAGPKTNEKFYPHDYALSPLDDKNRNVNDPKPTALPGSREGSLNSVDPASAVSINPDFEPGGKKIESISLIESGLDFEKLKRSTDVLIRLFNERSIRTSSIFLVGRSFDTPPPELNKQLRRLGFIGATVSVENSPPKNFKVTRLPSWIISTKEGDIVLEGLESPNRFISTKGEFIDPRDVSGGELDERSEEEEAKPTPKPKP